MKSRSGGSTPVTVVGTVTMTVGLLLIGVAGLLSGVIDDGGTDSSGIAIRTSTRWNHWDTVSGVLGVTLMVLGAVITYVGRRSGDR